MQQFIKHYLSLYKVEAPDLPEIKISRLPEEIKKRGITASLGQCFNNAVRYVMELSWYDYKDLAYVVGFGSAGCPTEHGIIRVDGHYYDPTWENIPGLDITVEPFFPIFEMDHSQLQDAIEANNNYPPDMMYWIREQKGICHQKTNNKQVQYD